MDGWMDGKIPASQSPPLDGCLDGWIPESQSPPLDAIGWLDGWQDTNKSKSSPGWMVGNYKKIPKIQKSETNNSGPKPINNNITIHKTQTATKNTTKHTCRQLQTTITHKRLPNQHINKHINEHKHTKQNTHIQNNTAARQHLQTRCESCFTTALPSGTNTKLAPSGL